MQFRRLPKKPHPNIPSIARSIRHDIVDEMVEYEPLLSSARSHA